MTSIFEGQPSKTAGQNSKQNSPVPHLGSRQLDGDYVVNS